MTLDPALLPVEVDLEGHGTLYLEQTAYDRRPFRLSVVQLDRTVAIRDLDSGDSSKNGISMFLGSAWVAVFRHDEGVLDSFSLPMLDPVISFEIRIYSRELQNLRLANFLPIGDGSVLFETEGELVMINGDGSVRWKRESANPAKYVQTVDENGIQYWNQGESILLSVIDGSQTS